jgi:hypothetical protein
MKRRNPVYRACFMIALFLPIALSPRLGRAALLSSEECVESVRPAPAVLGVGGLPLLIGGEKHPSPLSTNEAAAIVLTLIIIGLMVGFVEQSR